MPTLNIPKKNKTNVHQPTDMRRLRQKAYQSKEWRALRDVYIKQNPICEECIKKGKVTPAQDVHHIKSPFSKNNVNQQLLLDYNNLMSLCKQCHAEIHNRQEGKFTVQDVLRVLADLLDENKSDEEIEDEEDK